MSTSSSFSPEDITRLRAFLSQFPSSPQPEPSQFPLSATPIPPAVASSSVSFPPSQIAIEPNPSQTRNGLPPINHLYQSRQVLQQGIPALRPQPSPGLGFHPFLGNLPSTSLANQARLASASATLPHCGRRRGAAPQAPVLGQAAQRNFFAPCYVDNTLQAVRVVIRVLPQVHLFTCTFETC